MIDTQLCVETPEGVDLHLSPAGPIVRAQAWLIDAGVRFILLGGVGAVLGFLGATGAGLWMLAFFMASWLYFILFEVLNAGVTPGKHSLGLKVVHQDGTPVGWTASIIRNLLRAADMLPVGYAAGFISMLTSGDFRRIGDLAAGTVVIHAELPPAAADFPEVEPVPLPLTLDAEERRAIVDFAQRSASLTPERSRELAGLTAPLVSLATGARDGVATLRGYASWIVGGGGKAGGGAGR